MNPKIEQRWACHAMVAMGVTQTADGIKDYAARLHALAKQPAHEQAVAPLVLLQCAVHMMDELHEDARAGNERLRQLGLGDQMSAELPQAPAGMRELLDARLRDERPPIPRWLGPPRQHAHVMGAHKELDEDALAGLGLGGLDERLATLEAEQAQAQARAAFVQKYRPNDQTDMLLESAAVAAYDKLIGQARQAFQKLPAPTAWADQPTVTRRVMDKIALQQPALAQQMMTREKPVEVVEAAA